MTKVFISYHHKNDQQYKDYLVHMASTYNIFENISVDVGEISDALPPQTIRQIIRDRYLRDSDVTILLCGTETRYRKHVDWEIKSSMINGKINTKSGILVIDLPTTRSNSWQASLPGEKELLYQDYAGSWFTLETKSEFQEQYPDMPERIIDNLVKPDVCMSVVPWDRIEGHPERLRHLINETAKAGKTNEYDLSLKMRMRDHDPYSRRTL